VALNPEIRGAIHSFIQNYGDKDILEDLLTNEDWDQLESINQMLTILQQSTKSLEGSFASLYKVIPAMDFILQHFEQGRQDHSGTLMAPLYQSGWEKMRKYYNLLESTPAYVAAIVLHPGYKWDYIKAEWDPEWVVKSEVIYLSLYWILLIYPPLIYRKQSSNSGNPDIKWSLPYYQLPCLIQLQIQLFRLMGPYLSSINSDLKLWQR
jgi:hypothetical protein